MEGMFGSKLQSAEGVGDAASKLSSGVELVGIYFSAHWCPPCRAFTPMLAELYNKVNKNGKRLEIVFVSHDRTDDAFKEYFNDMPWLAIPFADEDGIKDKLIEDHNVSGIPKLVFLSKDGSVKFENGREKVMGDKEGASFPWN